MVLLSVKAGLRAVEIAFLTWRMVINPKGELGTFIHLPNAASKGGAGGEYPSAGCRGMRSSDCRGSAQSSD